MNKIIVPVNFSPCSLKAVEMAVEIAKANHCPLVLFHSVALTMGGFDTGYPTVSTRVQMVQKEAELERLKGIADQYSHECYANGAPVAITTVVEFGELPISLSIFVADEGVDFIVMGTEGSQGVIEDWMGTNAYAIVADTNVPVLVLPEKSPVRLFKHLVYATSFQAGDASAVETVRQFAQSINAELRILHIAASEEQAVYADVKIDDHVGQHSLHYTQISAPTPYDGLMGFIETENADLLCLLRPKRGFLENLLHQSVTKALILSANLPMLVLKES